MGFGGGGRVGAGLLAQTSPAVTPPRMIRYRTTVMVRTNFPMTILSRSALLHREMRLINGGCALS